MKFYIATRYSTDTLRKKAIALKKELEHNGHEMTYDWTSAPQLQPYAQHEAEAKKFAEIDVNAAMNADFFILLPCPNGTGMYVEYGAAIAHSIQYGGPKIFILGENKDCSMFNYHPSAHWVDSLEEILAFLEK